MNELSRRQSADRVRVPTASGHIWSHLEERSKPTGRQETMSAAGGFRITPDELQATARNIQQAAGNIENILSQVKGQVDATTGFWQGAAQANFNELMMRWQRDSQDLHQVLMQIAQNMQTASQNYAETEAGVARGFQVQ
ncbi:MAG TPA: WXG100 family type VII secretion target [Ktedonobacterales bacterium]|nr:WXG100 family type VII secretion target [Ktedonobacterales bacterium]